MLTLHDAPRNAAPQPSHQRRQRCIAALPPIQITGRREKVPAALQSLQPLLLASAPVQMHLGTGKQTQPISDKSRRSLQSLRGQRRRGTAGRFGLTCRRVRRRFGSRVGCCVRFLRILCRSDRLCLHGGRHRRTQFRLQQAKRFIFFRAAVPAHDHEPFAREMLPEPLHLGGFLEAGRQPVLHVVLHLGDGHPRTAQRKRHKKTDED